MKLMTKELLKKMPKLYETQNAEDPMVICKFFSPWSGWTWYATEFDGEDLFFGYVVGHERELGYFSLKEMESVRGPWLLGIERDLYFDPQPLSKVKALHT